MMTQVWKCLSKRISRQTVEPCCCSDRSTLWPSYHSHNREDILTWHVQYRAIDHHSDLATIDEDIVAQDDRCKTGQNEKSARTRRTRLTGLIGSSHESVHSWHIRKSLSRHDQAAEDRLRIQKMALSIVNRGRAPRSIGLPSRNSPRAQSTSLSRGLDRKLSDGMQVVARTPVAKKRTHGEQIGSSNSSDPSRGTRGT